MGAGSGNGKRNSLGLGLGLDEPDQATATTSSSAQRLLVDEGAWQRAGEELRARDPQRYLAILKVVEDICSIYRDPLGGNLADGHFIFGKDDPDHYD